MSKLISYRKSFKVGKGANLRDLLFNLIHNSDFEKYLRHMQGEEVVVSFEPAANKTEKEQLYAYYQKVVLSVAVQFFLDMGWNGMDRDTADNELKKLLSKDFIVNAETGEKITKVKGKSKMPKKELWQYIYNVIMFLEEQGYSVPESGDYKNKALTGIDGFKTDK